MRTSQITFIVIAALYFSLHLINTFITQEAYSVIPGWHVTLDPSGSFGRGLAVLFFLALSLIYGLMPPVNRVLLTLHAFVSVIPLGYYVTIRFATIDSLTLISYYRNSHYLELASLIIHGFFLGLLYFHYWHGRTPTAPAPKKARTEGDNQQ